MPSFTMQETHYSAFSLQYTPMRLLENKPTGDIRSLGVRLLRTPHKPVVQIYLNS